MALADFVLRTKVNLALAQQLSSVDVDVAAESGVITLTGEIANPSDCARAADIAERIEGVVRVDNLLTSAPESETSPTARRQKLLQRLDKIWSELPDYNAETQADYLRWALWTVHNFRTSPSGEEIPEASETVEEALELIASKTGIPKVLLALEMTKQAESDSSRESKRNRPPAG